MSASGATAGAHQQPIKGRHGGRRTAVTDVPYLLMSRCAVGTCQRMLPERSRARPCQRPLRQSARRVDGPACRLVGVCPPLRRVAPQMSANRVRMRDRRSTREETACTYRGLQSRFGLIVVERMVRCAAVSRHRWSDVYLSVQALAAVPRCRPTAAVPRQLSPALTTRLPSSSPFIPTAPFPRRRARARGGRFTPVAPLPAAAPSPPPPPTLPGPPHAPSTLFPPRPLPAPSTA